jgi:hypothetical protein
MNRVPQGDGEGLRAPLTVEQGGSFTVEVGPNDSTVEIVLGSGGKIISYSVTPGKEVTLPVPSVPAGTIIFISVGKGERRRKHVIEVSAPAP